jgi:hypothetical protein
MIDYQKHITNYLARGFRPFDPDFLFTLTQKGSKKVKTLPASLKKPAFVGSNRPNSLLRRSNRTIFNRRLICFLAHRTRSFPMHQSNLLSLGTL